MRWRLYRRGFDNYADRVDNRLWIGYGNAGCADQGTYDNFKDLIIMLTELYDY